MLPPEYFYGKSDKMIELYEQLQIWILKDITRRLLSAGGMTASGLYGGYKEDFHFEKGKIYEVN